MEKLRIKLEKWVHGGYTIGHFEGHAVFVTGGIPGELVDIIIHKSGKKEWFGKVTDVIESSLKRLDLDCEVFNECGGCSYRHIAYSNELEVKKGLLAESFPDEREFIEIIHGPDTMYRNNVQWQIEDAKVGFYASQSHNVIEKSNSACLNVDPKLLWVSIKEEKKKVLMKQNSVMLRLSDDDVIDYSKLITTVKLDSIEIKVPERGFFQINKFLLNPWLQRMNDWVTEGSKVLELFCGCGTIGIALNKKIQKLWGLESDIKSIEFAKQNVIDNNIENFLYNVYDLYKKDLPGSANEYDTWIMNPPRSGLSSNILGRISNIKPRKIIYSSCNASTLKRDVFELKKNGYQMKHLVLVDFFPRTMHYEVLTLLVRN